MPQYYRDKNGKEILVVTYEELVPEFYMSENYLRVCLSRANKRGFGMRSVRQGKGANNVALIEFDSLPNEIKSKLGDPRKVENILEKFYSVDQKAAKYYADKILPDGRNLPEKNVEEYTVNASVLNAILTLERERKAERMRRGSSLQNMWNDIALDARAFNKILMTKYDFQHTLPEDKIALKRKAYEYQENGYEVLIKRFHYSKNNYKLDDKTAHLLDTLYVRLEGKANYFEVHQAYTQFLRGKNDIVISDTGESLNPADYKSLDESSVRKYLQNWESKNATLRLRTGDRQKLIAALKPYHSFDKPQFAGSIVSVDDRQPPFHYGDGNARPWLYLAYDIASEAYTVIVHGKSKEGIILEFYRQMLRNYTEWGLNLPGELEAEMSLNSSYAKTFLKEGTMFQYVHLEGNNARGKRIERANRDMRYMVEKKLPGWIARPHANDEANQSSQAQEVKASYKKIIEMVTAGYDAWNNDKHSNGSGLSRWEWFLKNQNPNLQPTNWRALLPHIGYQTKTSCNVGIVRLDGGECLLGCQGKVALGDDLIRLMSLAEGEQFQVFWLDDNRGQILKAMAYDFEGNFICELISKPTYHRARIERTAQDNAACEIMSSYVATIEGYGRLKKRDIDRITILKKEQPTVFQTPVDVEILPQIEDDEFALVGVERTYTKNYNTLNLDNF